LFLPSGVEFALCGKPANGYAALRSEFDHGTRRAIEAAWFDVA
jgi:hypothetical protein